jgi:hypothetical protein
MLVHMVQKCQFYGIPFTVINSLCNCYHLLDVLSIVRCAEILLCQYCESVYKFFFSLIGNLKIRKLLLTYSMEQSPS